MPNDAMKAQVIEQWSGMKKTKLMEDGVREERVEEESRRSFNGKMSGETCWDKLCASDIHAQKHRFTRLPFETTVVPRSEKDRSVKSLFAVKSRRCQSCIATSFLSLQRHRKAHPRRYSRSRQRRTAA